MRGALLPRTLAGLALSLAGVACAGCASGGVDVDAGVSDAGSSPRGLTLRFTEAASLQLVPQQNATVEVRALLDGAPAAGVDVRLALEGDAHDASLMALSGSTGADGLVRTNVRGSSIPSTFRVRATATGAPATYLAVGVSATGFGSARVQVADLSATGPARVRAEAYSGASCASSMVAEGRFGRAITLLEGEQSASFLALPAAPGYALVARGLSATGEELAFGCADGVEVSSDAEVLVTVRLGARVQVIAGAYDADFRVEAADLGALLEAARAATLATTLAAGDAGFLLDALEAHLSAEGQTAALLALQSSRALGLDSAFETHLLTEGAGPSVALTNAVSFVASQSSLSLQGLMRIEANGDTTFDPESLALVGTSGVFSALPGPDAGAPNVVFVTELDLINALVTFDPVVITLPLGASVASILSDAQLLSGLGDWGALAGSASAAGFPVPSVEAVCDASCRTAVFASSAVSARDAWLALLGEDPGSFTLTLSGSASASDPDADLQANALDAQLGGSAASYGVSLPVVGTLSAVRRDEDVP